MKTPRLFVFIAIFISTLVTGYQSPSMAKEHMDCQEITAPEVKEMLEKGTAVVINVLSDIEYDVQHITGSISIPVTKLKTSNKLHKDKDMPIVFYCMGEP